MSKIIFKENGILKYKEVTKEELKLLQKEIESIVKKYDFSYIAANELSVSVEDSNGGNIIIAMNEYTCVQSICNICSANFGEGELSPKDAIALNITVILDNLEDILVRKANIQTETC